MAIVFKQRLDNTGVKKRIPMQASFLVPLLITVIICIDHEVFPFGGQCILHVDMYHQYCPFFTEMMEKLKTGGSFFYSWNIGLGADFVSLYAYYLASPLNWLLLLCPRGYVIEFMTVLVVLKIALCGLTFGYYLKMHFKTEHFAVSIFAAAYALSAFMAAYAWNIMWTDCLVLAPLIVLGLERLIKEGRPLLYYGTLAASILSNYYISIMICIFLVLWFLIYWLENKETGIRAWLQFAGYSLLAGGTGAVLILPTAVVLGYSGSAGTSFPDKVEWYFNIVAELGRHMVLTETYTGADHWPNLYCGVFVLVFFVLYLLNRGISWKRKLPQVLFVVLFVVSFANNIMDFIWHGMHFPTSLPGRQSFLYIFVLLVLSFEAFLHLRENRIWHVAAAGAVNAGFLYVVYHFMEEEQADGQAFLMTVILLGCYLLLIAGYLLGTAKIKRLMLACGCFAILAELTLNFDLTGLDTTSRTAYVEALDDYEKVLQTAKEDATAKGDLFYRTEELERRTKNDAALSGYRSATQFSSLMNLEVSHFYQNVGMEGGKNFYCINGATPLFSAMLSIRYILADNPLEESPMRSLVTSSGETYLYENKYVLPLGFMMSEEVVDTWDYKNGGDIEGQNNLAYLLGAEEQMLVPVPSVSAPGESEFDVDETGYYYAVYEKTSVDNLTLEVSDGRTRSYSKVSHGYILDFGYCTAGTTAKITNSGGETVSMTIYRLKPEMMETAYHALAEQTMELISFSDTKITGEIEVKHSGRLIFSIANEPGWTLYVDGEKTDAEMFGGAFISVHLEPGTHHIQLRYQTPGFWLGAGISAGCLAVFLLIFVYKKLDRKRS